MNNLAIHPVELRKLLQNEEEVVLIDIRPKRENQWFTIEEAICLPELELPQQIHRLQNLGRLVVFCHDGKRSRQVAQWMGGLDMDVRFLVGGVEQFVSEESGPAKF